MNVGHIFRAYGAASTSSGGPVTITRTDSEGRDRGSTAFCTENFLNKDIGAADADRFIVVVYALPWVFGQEPTAVSITIDGVEMDFLTSDGSSDADAPNIVSFRHIKWPTGTSASIEVSLTGDCAYASAIAVYRVVAPSAADLSVVDEAVSTSSAGTIYFDYPNNSNAVMLAAATGVNIGATGWVGGQNLSLDTQFDMRSDEYLSIGIDGPGTTTETNVSVQADYTDTSNDSQRARGIIFVPSY